MDVAYCTNIHSGADLRVLTAELDRTWLPVRQRLPAGRSFALGLWFPAQSAHEFVKNQSIRQLRECLQSYGFAVPTLNGFPFGDFHQDRVKKEVYHPNWFQSSRWDYTNDLISILAELAPANSTFSISTLPVAWRHPAPTDDQLALAVGQLQAMAERLRRLKDQTGIAARLCLEPEPGCYLQSSDDVVRFMTEQLFRGPDERVVRDHIAVCHDVCHAAVMREEQRDVLARYQQAGITIGKFQVSSALVADFHERLTTVERSELLKQLRLFAEDRYLHQTTIRSLQRTVFHDDLHDALMENPQPAGEWRVHFHVPIQLAEIGTLRTTQDEIRQLMTAIADDAIYASSLLEVETYAWSVLPEHVRTRTIDESIAAELNWFHDLIGC